MIQYHVFKDKFNFFLYLPDYKQLFYLDKNEYEILKSSISQDKKSEILNLYKNNVTKIDKYQNLNTKNKRYGLFLCIANICNARCVYCFANHGDYGKEKGIMPSAISNKAIDRFMELIPEDSEAYIIFFGGEPLLAFEEIVSTVEYTNKNYLGKKSYQFHIVTNGTLLNKEIIDFFYKNKFGVAISIDGGRDVQNSQRPLINQKNSYDLIVKNLDYLLNKIEKVHARGTYFDFDLSLVKIYDDLLKLGFREVNVPPDILNPKIKNTYPKLLSQLENLYEYIVEYIKINDDFPFGLFTDHIRRIFMPKIRDAFSCGLGETTYSVDIKGDIYPCHRYSSEIEYKMGNINSGIKKVNLNFNFSIKKCEKCWNRYTCSHGCSYNDLKLTGSSDNKNIYWCIYSQKMTELSLRLIPKLKEKHLKKILGIS